MGAGLHRRQHISEAISLMSMLSTRYCGLRWFAVIACCLALGATGRGQVLTFAEAKQRADAGDASAQAVVALHYQLGWNTEKNPELAAKYATASANAGHPLGQFRLGALLRAGEGVPKDEQQGLALQSASFNALYKAQDPYSMTSAAIMIFQGKVVGQNVSEDERRRDAAALYKKAAGMGYAPGQFNYAMALNDGHGVEKDLNESAVYLSLALTQSYPPARQFSKARHEEMLEKRRTANYESRQFGWVYEFVKESNEPTLSLSNDSAGLILYADKEFVVRASESPALSSPSVVKTELSFYDARTCELLGIVLLPNRVFKVGSLRSGKNAIFYAGTTATRAKGAYDDFPLALTLIDFRSRVLERIPLVEDDYWIPLNNRVELSDAGRTVSILVPHELLPKFVLSQPAKPEFEGIKLELCESAPSTSRQGRPEQRIPRFQGDNEGTLEPGPEHDEENRKLHIALTKHDDAALVYLGPHAITANDLHGGMEQFAVGNAVATGRLGGLIKTTDTGRLVMLNPITLQSQTHSVDSQGAFAPHQFENGDVACIAGSHVLVFGADGKKREVAIPDADPHSIRRLFKGGEIGETPQATEVVADSDPQTPQKLMFADSALVYRCGARFFQYNALTSSGFEELAIEDGIRSQLAKSEYNQIKDYDAATKTFVISQHQFDLPRYQRISSESGDPVGAPWEGGGHGVYGGMTYSRPSGGWRAFSFIDEATTAGVSSCVMLERVGVNNPPFLVAQGLPSNADPLALKVVDRSAQVVYGSGDEVSLVHVDLSSGQIERKHTWTFASRLGKALIWSGLGNLLIPTASGFEVWTAFGNGSPERVCDLVLGSEDHYAVLLPNGTYAGSPGCESLLRLKAGDGKVDGSSIAKWRNRPAEVLKALGGDSEQIEVLAKVTERWQKRIGFDPSKPEPKASDLPKVAVPERPPLWAESDEVQLPVEWQAGASPVSRVIVRVNGVEGARFEGDTLPNAAAPKGSVEAKVKLAEGQNWIEVTAEDVEGRSSDLQRFRTILKDSPTDTKRYIIALGVSEYAKPELNLQFAAKDANDLLVALAGEGAVGGGILSKLVGWSEGVKGSDHVLLLTDSHVDETVVDKIREFVSKASESDEVILFCAGHGVLDDKLDYYFAGHNFDPESPAETGIKLDDLVDAVSSAKALRRLILLDTCHAGVVGEKDEMLLAQMDTKLPTGVRAVAHRGMKVQQAADFSASDKQRFIEEMFSLPGTIRGVNIIGASAGAQFALESDQWNNGVFTASVIDGLRGKKADWNEDGRITVSELKNYLGHRVSELTAGAQKPSVVAFEQDQDFDLLN
jgi:hypothetical protein